MRRTVTLVPYDPRWPQRFEEERQLLAAAFAGAQATIEHIGSTAVPGLGAKPVIDILLGLPRLAEAESRVTQLAELGYEYVRAYEEQIPERRYFRKPPLGTRVVHLHCVVVNGEFWRRHLAFRDHLRAHPQVAHDYHELKLELAARCGKDEYTDAKGPFIEKIVALALGGATSGPPRDERRPNRPSPRGRSR